MITKALSKLYNAALDYFYSTIKLIPNQDWQLKDSLVLNYNLIPAILKEIKQLLTNNDNLQQQKKYLLLKRLNFFLCRYKEDEEALDNP